MIATLDDLPGKPKPGSYFEAMAKMVERVKMLEEALRPLALLSGEFDETWSDMDQLVVEFDEHGEGGNGFPIHRFNVGDARRAAALLRTSSDEAVSS